MNKDKKIKQVDIDVKGKNSDTLASEILDSINSDEKYEKGKVLAGISMSYIEMLNEINAAYIERLQKILGDFNDLEKGEVKFKDDIKLSKVRMELKK
ncbi:MAG: hypothetical protein PHN69_00190 [Candidatus Pacebacteria bacterium]|nr:hypothetical protein [Candidatus Paceibacterota bacterium]